MPRTKHHVHALSAFSLIRGSQHFGILPDTFPCLTTTKRHYTNIPLFTPNFCGTLSFTYPYFS